MTLAVNMVKMVLGFITGILVARYLGPKNYGNLKFLMGTFGSFMALIDMGTSSAFYTFISRTKRSGGFFVSYFVWNAVQFIISLGFILFIIPDALREKIWLDQSKDLVILAFFASFSMQKIWPAVNQVGESIRYTIKVQIWNLLLGVLHLVLIIIGISFSVLSISYFLIISVFEHVVLAGLLFRSLKNEAVDTKVGSGSFNFWEMLREYKAFCVPLILYVWVSFVSEFADKWLLQCFGGAAQQGFFAVSERLSALSLIFTSSMLKIFWKEIAEAEAGHNYEKMRGIYERVTRSLYVFSAFIGCMLVPHSREILILLLGPDYAPAWPALALMFLYPVHQCLGQISGTFYMATGKTKTFRNIGVIQMLIGVLVTYFVLAPSSKMIPGMGLGSFGIAIKMVLVQFAGVNVMLYFISRIYKWPFEFLYQILIIAVLLPLAYISKQIIHFTIGNASGSLNPILLMGGSILLYAGITLVIVYRQPNLAGIRHQEVEQLVSWIKTKLSGSWKSIFD